MAKHRAPETGHHQHEHGELPEEMGAEFWDARYGEQDALWSGRANPHLVSEAGKLAPGTALEVGAGEGGDALWLADNGWEVTAIDISQVALDRARAHADGRAIDWQQADVLDWTPPAAGFDLVNAHYFHLREPNRARAMATLAAAVAVGGTFLFVGHAPGHMEHGPHEDMLQTPQQVVAGIVAAGGEWEAIAAETRTRPAVDHPSGQTELTDAVVVLRRR